MTTFKGIRGTTIEVVSSDPANPELGQIWYNSSSGTLKGYIFATVNAWASGGSLNTARFSLAASGSQTAALAFGGTGTPDRTTASESYNGTSWTNTPSMNTARSNLAGSISGTQTAALAFGGWAVPGSTTATESYNGSWTSVNSLNNARWGLGGTGTQAAGLAFGGYPGGPATPQTITESWNGTSWTSTPANLNTGREMASGIGLQTAALAAGNGTNSESYNGTSWTATSALNTSRNAGSANGAGTQTAGLIFGGNGFSTGATELWNGTSWTSNPNGLATARIGLAGCGTQTVALATGGYTPATTAVTEEWTGQALLVKTITVS